MAGKTKRLIIIDSNSVIHRAYHALPSLTTKKGELVNAVYGFLLVFLRALKDFQPDFIAATFDFPAPTFRHKKYRQYKAKRPSAPEELYGQIPKVKEALRAFGVQIFEKKGFEADDVIGTIATIASRKQIFPKIETIILSGDLDALQLINSRTKVFLLRKGVKDVVLYDEELAREKFQGLRTNQLLDFKALRGDPSDNIPGATGIGEKTAISLLLEFGNLERIYKEIAEKSKKSKKIRPRLKEILLGYKGQVFLSREMAKIERAVPLDFSLAKCSFKGLDREKAKQILERFEFYSLIGRLLDGGKENSVGENLKLW